MSDNKLIKTVLDAATLAGIAAGINWVIKKVAKENFTSDPRSSAMNCVQFTAVIGAALRSNSIALKQYLQKILPDNVLRLN